MTEAMNGALCRSTNDGWVPEFARHGINTFVLPESNPDGPAYGQEAFDAHNRFTLLETVILPIYCEQPTQWLGLMKTNLHAIMPYFNSDRMATKYYETRDSLAQPVSCSLYTGRLTPDKDQPAE